MDALLTENLDKEFRRPVRDFVRIREVWRAVHHDKELDDSSNLAKIAHGNLEHAQQFNGHLPHRELGSIQANLTTHFPAEEFTVLLAQAAGEINVITGTNERCERRHISIDDGRHDVG